MFPSGSGRRASRVVKVFQNEHAFLNSFFGRIPGLPEFVNFVDFMFDNAKGLVLVLTTEHLFVIDSKEKFLQVRVSLWRILAISASRCTLEIVIVPRASIDATASERFFSSTEFCTAAKSLIERGLNEY